MHPFEAYLAEQMQRRYVRLIGRGATALYIALRTLSLESPARYEIILPDIACSVVLDTVLLAGYVPIFANVTDRFALNWPHVRLRIIPNTQAIITVHNYGYAGDINIANVPIDVPIIEDAVQGLGGHVNNQPIGTLGKISFTSFHPTKMINGYGGLVATDDPDLWSAIQHVEIDQPISISPYAPHRYHFYSKQLSATRDFLICPFDWSSENIQQIRAGWQHLQSNVASRNEKAAYVREKLRNLPVSLPVINPGDAIWRYTFAAPTLSLTRWILRHLQLSGLPGSNLYPSLSNIFQPDLNIEAASVAPRLINLWIDEHTTTQDLDKMIAIIRSAPFERYERSM